MSILNSHQKTTTKTQDVTETCVKCTRLAPTTALVNVTSLSLGRFQFACSALALFRSGNSALGTWDKKNFSPQIVAFETEPEGGRM